MISENQIKIEGRVGLLYNRDTQGVYVSADSALSGQLTFCPFCGCRMHVTTTKSGIRIFARNPGAIHTNPICINAENKKVQHSFSKCSPEDLITKLCRVSPKGGTASGNGKTPGSGKSGGDNPDSEIKESQFSSLKQIYDAGINYLNPDDKQGNHRVSDFIITFKYGNQFFPNSDFRLGCRIVMARYDGFDSKSQSIIYSQFSKGNYSVKFRLVFPKKSDFKKVRDKFAVFAEDEQTGKTIVVERHKVQDVLIACDNWEYIPRDRCQGICSYNHNCEKCCGMYQAVFTNKNQLYLIPSDH